MTAQPAELGVPNQGHADPTVTGPTITNPSSLPDPSLADTPSLTDTDDDQGDALSCPVMGTALILEDFLPYRLSVLANTVSRALARLYEQRFGLTVAEWRIMAVLARFGPLSANAVCDRTAMDKVQVSRAVARAVDNGLVDRGIDAVDRRRSVLTLTPKGRGIHDQIVPLAANLQSHLMVSLTPEENIQLYDMLSRLYLRARELHGSPDEE